MGSFISSTGTPFALCLYDKEGNTSPDTIQGDYFRREVFQYDEMGDYTDPELLVPVKSYEWHWTMGDIITALCDAGMRIVFLHEFPQYFYNGYTPYDVENDRVELYPCTFSLKAVAR